jgi:hypothetical protein
MLGQGLDSTGPDYAVASVLQYNSAVYNPDTENVVK